MSGYTRYSVTASRELVNTPCYDDDADDYLYFKFHRLELAAEVAEQLSRQCRYVSLHDNEHRLNGGTTSIIASWWNREPKSTNLSLT